jgi:hypothetical protein
VLHCARKVPPEKREFLLRNSQFLKKLLTAKKLPVFFKKKLPVFLKIIFPGKKIATKKNSYRGLRA